jgi:excisionase family DNA binding protein
MLATTDNRRKRATAAAEVMTAEEAAKWFTRPGLAAALKVSVSTIDRMVKSEELPCVRLRGRVRFYLPDVVEALRKGDRKFGRAAELTAESAKIAERGQAS